MVNRALTDGPAAPRATGDGAASGRASGVSGVWRTLRLLDADPLERAIAEPCDALILDPAGAPQTPAAADVVAALSARAPRPPILVLVSVREEGWEAAVAALASSGVDGFAIGAVESAADVQQVGARLAVEEAKAGLEDGALALVPLISTGGALFELPAIAAASDRLVALGWDGEALGVDLGAETGRDDGFWIDPLQTARTLTLAAARAAGLPAIDCAWSGATDDALSAEASRARRDGFSGKIALDAGQAAIIAAAWSARPGQS
ncbi:aldolase/citrate lyase family protein [Hansschlegelia sp. KR7-227]|uniref:aldolase/citrate lyase family protein n=1 Tax=Hansschlegelia sp. KR7-227 TaxID=3400914 RepID=UPI003C092A44